MPFARFKLHPDLLRGTRELGFTRATPIQEQAIPPALEGKEDEYIDRLYAVSRNGDWVSVPELEQLWNLTAVEFEMTIALR